MNIISAPFPGGLPVGCPQASVEQLEELILQIPQVDIPTLHRFLPGVYERTIIIPPGTVLTGAEHKTDYRIRLTQGTISVNTDDGMLTLTAPCEFEAKAGLKRVGYVGAQEVIWTDIYSNPDDCRDLNVIEERLYVVPAIGLADSRTAVQKAVIDYGVFLHEFGLAREDVRAISCIESDLIDMPLGFNVELRESSIHGQGLFATAAFKKGDIVCPGRLGGKRTPGGRYINHSPQANIIPVKEGDDIWAKAYKDIAEGAELLVNYRDSLLVNYGTKALGELL